MLKFLREMDRKRNGLADFPKLYYPELYLAHGGYKSFYEQFPVSICTVIHHNISCLDRNSVSQRNIVL